MPNKQPTDDLDAWFQGIKSIVEHPAFQKTVEEIKSLPSYEGLQIAFSQLTPQTLMRMGVPIPPGTLISVQASQDARASKDDTDSTASSAGPLVQIKALLCLPFVPVWFEQLLLEAQSPSPNW